MMFCFVLLVMGGYFEYHSTYEDIFNIKYRSVMLDCRGRLDYLKKCMY